MNRNSVRTQSSLIIVVNGSALGNPLYSLLDDLSRSLPDCEFRQVDKKPETIDVSSYPSNSMFLILNTDDRHPGV